MKPSCSTLRRWSGLVIMAIASGRLVSAANFQLVSAGDSSPGSSASANGDSYMPVVSPDGRYVLFASAANNLVMTNSHGPTPGATLHKLNVYLRDRLNGTTTLVSANLRGDGGNDNSFPAAISTNGQYALFESAASDLVAGDQNNAGDIFLRDTVNGITKLISVATNGASGNGESHAPVMTPDGRYIAFVSQAGNLVAGDTNRISDIFFRDVQAGTTAWASAGARTNGQAPVALRLRIASESPSISDDGRYVAFFSTATNLVSGVTSACEIYVRDMIGGVTTWASTNGHSLGMAVGMTNAVSGSPAMSANGRYIAYVTCTNVPSGVSAPAMVMRYDLQTGLTDLVYTNVAMPLSRGPFDDFHILDISVDGRFIAFVASNAVGGTMVCRWDGQTASNSVLSVDQTSGLPAGGFSDNPVTDPTGRYVAFTSTGANLTTNSSLPNATHLYVFDALAGNIQMIDVDTNGAGIGLNPDTSGLSISLSTNGLVAFDSAVVNLVADDLNKDSDVYVRDLSANTMELVSMHHPVLPSFTLNRFSDIYSTSMSTNGRYVAFASTANNAGANDTNHFSDVFVRDLVAGTNIPVSLATNRYVSGDDAIRPAISGNGRYVAFASQGAYVAADNDNGGQDVYLRDLQTGDISLISTESSGASYSPVVNNDGRFVLYRSLAVLQPVENLMLCDRQLGTNYMLTTAASIATPFGVWSSAMTPDGRYVAYSGLRDGSATYRFFLWDTQAGKLVYTNNTLGWTNIVISSDGRWTVDYVGGNLFRFDLINKTNGLVGAFPSTAFRDVFEFSADGRFLLIDTRVAAVAGDTNGTYDVYLHDFQTGTNILVSHAFNSSNSGNNQSDQAVMSPDGRFVAYCSKANNIVPGDTNGVPDIFLFDRINDATMLVSAGWDNLSSANGASLRPIFSGDGSKLIFESYASNLSAPGYNEYNSIYALSLNPVTTDSDGDGMDDQWELDHFGTLARDGTGDFDGDGASDLFEFLTGTDPTDPTSFFHATISGVLTPGRTAIVDWPIAPGRGYQVQYTDDLNSPWQNVNASVTLIGNRGRITDLTPSTGKRFYRIVMN